LTVLLLLLLQPGQPAHNVGPCPGWTK